MGKSVACLVILTACFASGAAQAQPQRETPTQVHGYYLYLAEPPKGCEDYVPLLVTTTRLEEMQKQKPYEPSIVITTYERDSLVGPPRRAVVSVPDYDPRERKVRVDERLYRYHEISASEVLSLLEHPGGSILISRIPSMRIPSAAELAELIARFRAVKP